MTTATTVKTTKTTMTKAEKHKIKMAKKTAGKIAKKAAAKKNVAAMKKAGKGIFAPKSLSESLASICGKKTMPRTEVTKAIWAYIKKNKLSEGRIIKPDAALKKIFPVASLDMFKPTTARARYSSVTTKMRSVFIQHRVATKLEAKSLFHEQSNPFLPTEGIF